MWYFFPSDVGQKPVDIVNAALKEAKLKFYDVLLVDTAGRLHVDEAMMDEIKQVHASIKPVETLFVVGCDDRSGCGEYRKSL